MRLFFRPSPRHSATLGLLVCSVALAGACTDDSSGTPTTPTSSIVQVAVSPARVLVNGGFEQGPAVPHNDVIIKAGSTDLTGWTVTRGDIKYLGAPWNVSNGRRAIDIDGTMPGELTQTFATLKDRTYVIWFDLAGDPQGDVNKQVRVSVGDFVSDYTFNTSGQTRYAPAWQPISLAFVATGASTTLRFTSLSGAGSSHGALIDNVRMIPPQ